jgi:hypothetical protein
MFVLYKVREGKHRDVGTANRSGGTATTTSDGAQERPINATSDCLPEQAIHPSNQAWDVDERLGEYATYDDAINAAAVVRDTTGYAYFTIVRSTT